MKYCRHKWVVSGDREVCRQCGAAKKIRKRLTYCRHEWKEADDFFGIEGLRNYYVCERCRKIKKGDFVEIGESNLKWETNLKK